MEQFLTTMRIFMASTSLNTDRKRLNFGECIDELPRLPSHAQVLRCIIIWRLRRCLLGTASAKVVFNISIVGRAPRRVSPISDIQISPSQWRSYYFQIAMKLQSEGRLNRVYDEYAANKTKSKTKLAVIQQLQQQPKNPQ